MTADWKKKPLEKVQPKPTHAQLLKEIEQLEERAQILMQEKKQLADAARYFEDSRNRAVRDQARFNALLDLELMVQTKDGFKLMTGSELFELADNLAYPRNTVDKILVEKAARIQQEMYDYLVGAKSWHKLLKRK